MILSSKERRVKEF
ncbi:Protein of unknown function [Bacillus cytotoxicus]|uniref:Uncharacterized protein n=1 Tax=Bacillus cytotoxicus TaxID=580165 RepID=A0AAX2CG84_9BACI|nr:Protein of unknown function [Bacillus cytotoxicus]SCN35708.1 Protein of unknown function [Bacillus cytotoxicus]